MAVEKTKHAFVDDNPYIVYSGDSDSTIDNAGGGSGGGGGNDGYFLVTVTNPESTDTGMTGTADKSKTEVINAINNGKIVFLKLQEYDPEGDVNNKVFLALNSVNLTDPVLIMFNVLTLADDQTGKVLYQTEAQYGDSEYEVNFTTFTLTR